MKTKEEDRLMTAAELAVRLSCSLSAAYALARRGLIPCVRIGGMIRFRRSDVNDALQQAHSKKHDLELSTREAIR